MEASAQPTALTQEQEQGLVLEPKLTLLTITDLPPLRFTDGQVVGERLFTMCLYYAWPDKRADMQGKNRMLSFYANPSMMPSSISCYEKDANAKIKAKVDWLVTDTHGPLQWVVKQRAEWDKSISASDLKALFTRVVGVPPDAKLEKVPSVIVSGYSPFPFPVPKTMTATQYWSMWELVHNEAYGSKTKTVPGVEGVLFARHARQHCTIVHVYITTDYQRHTVWTDSPSSVAGDISDSDSDSDDGDPYWV